LLSWYIVKMPRCTGDVQRGIVDFQRGIVDVQQGIADVERGIFAVDQGSSHSAKGTATMAQPAEDKGFAAPRLLSYTDSALSYTHRTVEEARYVGRRLSTENLQGGRAADGKQIFVTVSRELTVELGQAFTLRSLYRAAGDKCQPLRAEDKVTRASVLQERPRTV
jgi:hypothetical protein